ncbi:MAG TPA: GntR family transcriptional regulator [Roseiarcus sp.]|nr:GntR family transcriptional regulator [Roseiarcus sp.]
MAKRKAALRPPSALHANLVREIVLSLNRARTPVGAPIREPPLAKALAVSRTPVRSALRVLEQMGFVRFEARRGFTLARSVETNGAIDRLLPRSPDEMLQEAIIADRAASKLAASVSEAELVARYRVSRGAVRRVMMTLRGDGIAQRLPGYGWRFSEMLDSPQAIRESYEFRIAVECAALGQPGFSAPPDELDELRKAHEVLLNAPGRFEPRIWFSINSRFHEAIASWSGNRFLLDAIRRQNALRKLDEYHWFRDLEPESIRRSLDDHIAILAAIAEGETEWAASLMKRHLELHGRDYPARVPGLPVPNES